MYTLLVTILKKKKGGKEILIVDSEHVREPRQSAFSRGIPLLVSFLKLLGNALHSLKGTLSWKSTQSISHAIYQILCL